VSILEMLHTHVLCWPDRLVVEIGIGAKLGEMVANPGLFLIKGTVNQDVRI